MMEIMGLLNKQTGARKKVLLTPMLFYIGKISTLVSKDADEQRAIIIKRTVLIPEFLAAQLTILSNVT